jgi:hypothetical protein
MFMTVAIGMFGFRVRSATTSATAMEMDPGPHCEKLEKKVLRAWAERSVGRNADMKKMNA